MKRQIFTNERRRAVKRSLKMKFRVDVTRVVPLLPRKGVDSSTCWYYTRVFLNLGPSLPPRTLCKYSNGTANGAPLFDSLKAARSKEIGSRKLRLKFYFTSFNFSSRVTRECCFSLLAPFFRGGRWLHVGLPQNLHEISRRPVFADLKLHR